MQFNPNVNIVHIIITLLLPKKPSQKHFDANNSIIQVSLIFIRQFFVNITSMQLKAIFTLKRYIW